MSLEKDLKADFRNFVYYIWKHLNLPDPTPVQYDIAHFLATGASRRGVLAYRGVGKSFLTGALCAWWLYKDPVNEKILVTSASKDRADAFSIFVKQLIHDVPVLQHLKPEAGRRDSNIAFDVGGASISQSPSVKSAGITGQITGSRATRIISDDVETPNNSLTQLQRERLLDRVREYDAILVPEGDTDIVYLGTPQSEMSIYNELPERGYEFRVWTARMPETKKITNYKGKLAPYIMELDLPQGEAVDPQRFDNEDLALREASYGKTGFALQFMLDTTLSDEERYPLKLRDLIVMDVNNEQAPVNVAWGSGEDQVINDIGNVGFSGDKWHKPMMMSKEWQDYDGTVMYIDPAGRGTDEVGYAVIKKLGSLLFLSDAGGLEGGYDEDTLVKLSNIAKQSKVNKIIIEPNFGDGMYLKLMAPVISKIHPCTIEDAPWSSTMKEKKIIDILEPVMMRHLLVVDRALVEKDQKRTDKNYQLFYQMTRLTNQKDALLHDDALEAVAGAVAYFIDAIGITPEDNLDRVKEDFLQAELDKIMAAQGLAPANPLNFINTQGYM